jgi:hypothetical protein
MIILYAAADFVLQYYTSVEVSPTLTNAWFAFWGGELLCITGIKITKVLTKQDNDTSGEAETVENDA